MVRLQTARNDANSVYYRGTSYFPLGLGQIFTIQNQAVEHELVVIEVSHLSQVHGNTAGKNVSVSAGKDISSSAAMNMIDSAGININQIASADFMLMAKNITKIASENYSADAKDISRNASGKIEAISVEEHIQNSKGKIENLSGEKSLNA